MIGSGLEIGESIISLGVNWYWLDSESIIISCALKVNLRSSSVLSKKLPS